MKRRRHPATLLGPSIALASIAFLSMTTVIGAESAKEDPKASWRSGPVRYLLTADEDKSYKALKTDDERAKAIEQFWAKRDPSPGTPQNEYRDQFFKLVEEANSQFREAAGAGWTTDRGKMLLTAGSADSKKAEGDDREIWLYSRPLPAGSKAAEGSKAAPALRIVFEKDESGSFRMSTEGGELLARLHELDPMDVVKFALPGGAAAPKADAAPKPAAGEARPPATGGAATGAAASGSASGAALAAEKVPEELERLRQAATASEPRKDLPVSVSIRYFKADDSSTRTVVMIALRKADLTASADGKPAALLYARLVAKDSPDAQPVEFLEQQLFHPYDDAKEGYVKYAFSWPLKKRSYDLRVAVSDGKEGKIGTFADTLALPDFKGDALMLSSVTLARSKTVVPGDAPTGSTPGAKETADSSANDPWTLGSLRLVPWVTPTLGPGDDLDFFYDVYNAKHDPATNQVSLDVTYTFEKKEPAGWKAKGRTPDPGKHEERLGLTVPADQIGSLPAGDYRVTIAVHDKVASADATATVEFSVKK